MPCFESIRRLQSGDFIDADIIFAAFRQAVAPEIDGCCKERAGLRHTFVDQRRAGLELVSRQAAEVVGVVDGLTLADGEELGIALVANVDAVEFLLALGAAPRVEAAVSAAAPLDLEGAAAGVVAVALEVERAGRG